MMKKKIPIVLFCLVGLMSVKTLGQNKPKQEPKAEAPVKNAKDVRLNSCRLKTIERFNTLFGDHYVVNEQMQIKPVDSAVNYSFKALYAQVKTNNWDYESVFKTNLDATRELGNRYKDVLTLNLKLSPRGVYYNEFGRSADAEAYYQNFKSADANFFLSKEEMADYMKAMVQDLDAKTRTNENQQVDKTKNGKKNDPDVRNLLVFFDTLRATVKRHNIGSVYFFIHGYNVTHSLAQMQGNKVIARIHQNKADRNDTSKALFVRVFWDAGTRKNLSVKTTQANGQLVLKKMVYSDKKSLGNAFGFSKKRNEGTECGYTIRRILMSAAADKELKELNYNFVTHSLGAMVATECLVNDLSVIRYRKRKIEKIMKGFGYVVGYRQIDSVKYMVANYRRARKGKMPVCKRRKRAFEQIVFLRHTYQLPGLQVKAFMNAPAIGGNKPYRYANVRKDYHFFVGYNRYDPTLAKRFLFKNTMLSGALSRTAGPTTLGLNFDNEVGQTAFSIDKKRQIDAARSKGFTFIGFNSSNYFQHDLFYYMKHPLFNRVFNNFYNYKL